VFGRILLLALLFASPAIANAEPLGECSEITAAVDVDGGASDDDQDSNTINVMPEDDDVIDVPHSCSGITCSWAPRIEQAVAPFESIRDRRLRPPCA
jgi:hypothetical protein